MEKVLLRERHGEIEKLILNREGRGNALNVPLLAALRAAFAELAADPSVQLIVVTGRGNTFCAQADGGEFFGAPDSAHAFMIVARDLYLFMRTVPKPIIAAVNGLARMGGLELALSCDLIVASSTAVLGDAHPGGIPGGGASQLLPGAVGVRMARWLLYTGEMLSAQRAYEVGLVQQVIEAAHFDAGVLDLARRIVSRRMGNSLARIKTLTARRWPPAEELDFEIEQALGHYFEPEVVAAIPGWGEREGVFR
ncbi:MAG: enoyl-CoA hydratase/isomerase family protein [Candidatus Binatia bacterium]